MAMSASGSDGFAGTEPALPPAGVQSAGRRLRECITLGCQRVFTEPNHRHCCSLCSEGSHTSRCNRRQRRRQRARITNCWQVGCRRRADVSHTFCCSDCRHYQGRCHTQGCTERQHDLFAEAAMMSGPTAEDATVQPMEIVAVPTSAPFQTFYLAEPVVVTSGNTCVATGTAAVGMAVEMATGGEAGGESMAREEAEEAGEISFLHLMD